MQTLGIEPYETEVVWPMGSLLATLDNRTRLPLLTDAPTEPTVVDGTASLIITSIAVRDFVSGEAFTISGPDGASGPFTLRDVEPVDDIVYLDDNFLVYPGLHRINLVSDRGAGTRG
jgi:hypothetical protein